MQTDSRALVELSERERPIVLESDLELNFPLCKEVCIACMEKSLELPSTDMKEIPYLSDFEAGLCSLHMPYAHPNYRIYEYLNPRCRGHCYFFLCEATSTPTTIAEGGAKVTFANLVICFFDADM